jgi:hypothetical protein
VDSITYSSMNWQPKRWPQECGEMVPKPSISKARPPYVPRDRKDLPARSPHRRVRAAALSLGKSEQASCPWGNGRAVL